jgi:hypothetical protein
MLTEKCIDEFGEQKGWVMDKLSLRDLNVV